MAEEETSGEVQPKRKRRGRTMGDLLKMSGDEYQALVAGQDTVRSRARAASGTVTLDPAEVEAFRAWLLEPDHVSEDDARLLSALNVGASRKKALLRYVRRWVDAQQGRLTADEGTYEALYAAACGFGPLQVLLEDPAITEITVQAPDRVLVQKKGISRLAKDIAFTGGHKELENWIMFLVRLAGQRVGADRPSVSFALADGSRVTVVVPPTGLSLSLRRKRPQAWTLAEWIAEGSMSQEMADWLQAIFATGRLGTVLVGGSGTGKTSAAEACIPHYPVGNILLIQENDEIHTDVHPSITALWADQRQPYGPRGLRAVATQAQLVAPRIVIIGEVKNSAVVGAILAVRAGSGGAMTTCHADDAPGGFRTLEIYCLENKEFATMGAPAIRETLAQTFPVCIVLARAGTGRVYVSAITQVEWDREGQEMRFVPTFTGQEVPGETDIVFSAGPGLEQPIERVGRALALGGGASGAGIAFQHETRDQARELYRQALAATDAEDYPTALTLLEQAHAADPADRIIEQTLREHRLRMEAHAEAWEERLERLRQNYEEAAEHEDESRVREALLGLDHLGGGAGGRTMLRREIQEWLTQHQAEEMAERETLLGDADKATLLAWGETLWRSGEDDWAQRFFERVLELDETNYTARAHLAALALVE